MRKIGEMERGLPTSDAGLAAGLQTLFHGYLKQLGRTPSGADRLGGREDAGWPPQADRRLDQMPAVRRFLEQEPRPTRRYVTSYFMSLREATEARQNVKGDGSLRPLRTRR